MRIPRLPENPYDRMMALVDMIERNAPSQASKVGFDLITAWDSPSLPKGATGSFEPDTQSIFLRPPDHPLMEQGAAAAGLPLDRYYAEVAGHEGQHRVQQWDPDPRMREWDTIPNPHEDFEGYLLHPAEMNARAGGWVAAEDPALPFDRQALIKALSHPTWEWGPLGVAARRLRPSYADTVVSSMPDPQQPFQMRLPFAEDRRSHGPEEPSWLRKILGQPPKHWGRKRW